MAPRIILFLLSTNFCFPTTTFAQYRPPANDQEYEQQYQERIKKDRLNGVYIPKNLEEALTQLDKLTSAESKKIFMGIPEDTVCMLMHNRLGAWMISNWSFYEGSRLSHYLHSAGVTYPDDMADLLILAFHRRLHAKPVEMRGLAQHFREQRKKILEAERSDGEVLKETVRKRPRPEGETPPPPAADPKIKTKTPAAAPTPKGPGIKQ